eukprot:4911080-Pleurochrysis_carterae.AAC.1
MDTRPARSRDLPSAPCPGRVTRCRARRRVQAPRLSANKWRRRKRAGVGFILAKEARAQADRHCEQIRLS